MEVEDEEPGSLSCGGTYEIGSEVLAGAIQFGPGPGGPCAAAKRAKLGLAGDA